ncbi:sensor histidine kinase [Quisquiliibacterium transsilvanicum]|uniref:histidine kinase n=1 Tax=Quisquiliibacterium transsilvanicum TaxID=1549638 RepID=A0A7W8HGF6_9BURK|nr:ATP-binding protein [Quisquiliibacterium transsilvanicum]MBB5271639.1 two-component system sensor histidine kinase PilS (NtrC family) [Quisquiliibacterium transsilvanicum]
MPTAPLTAPPEARAAPRASFWTSLRLLSLARVVLATVLVLPAIVGGRVPWADVVVHDRLYAAVSFAWLALSFLFLAVAGRWKRHFMLQLVAQALTDLACLVLLMHAAGGPRSGLGVLTVAAVAGAAVLAPPRLSAFFAAAATLMLLAESSLRQLAAPSFEPTAFFAAGVIGAACFVTAALVGWLASRLSAQEALAQERGADLRSQLAVTQLVVAQLGQGVVVFDRAGGVRTMNPSARALFAAGGGAGALARVRSAAHSLEAAGHEGLELALDEPGVAERHRVRVRALRPESGALGDTVVVIDDLRELEERAQQLKLASMGRLSASIAHEIRNPLAAIRHANGLLAEQLGEPRLQRLARIVETNTVRIDRVVEDVLAIARRERPSVEPLELARFLEVLIPEIVVMTGTDRRRIEVALSANAPILFDPGQLRQVLVNLIGNALRYASDAPGAVRIQWRRDPADRLELRVSDDGPGLAPGMIEHVFEPFFTTESRGTGLGLYLAREFCAANGAALRYEVSTAPGGHRTAFVIAAAQPEGG